MKKIRKVNKEKRKQQRKDAQKRMEEQISLFSEHPKECCVCKDEFKRNRTTVKTWQITIREKRVRLTCPKCWDIIKKALESE